MTGRMTLKGRIVTLSVGICAAFLLVMGWSVFKLRAELLSTHCERIGVASEMAASLVGTFVEAAKSGSMPEADARKAALAAVKKMRYMGGEYLWVQDTTPRMLMHPIKPEMDGKDLGAIADSKGKKFFTEMAEVARKNGGGFVEYTWPKPGGKEPLAKISNVRHIPEWGWVVGTGVYLEDVNKDIVPVVVACAGAGVLIIASCLAASVFVANRIVNPLMDAVRALNDGTQQMSEASETVSSVSQTLAEGASSQAASVEETSAAMTEITAMTRQNAEHTEAARLLVERTNAGFAKANESMGSMVSQMGEIASMGEEVGKIIRTIDEIAFQTNLLALNAAVEAARAGEAGAGFAVVADEVRNLAQRAAGAARNTSDLIDTTVRKINDGATLLAKTNGDFQDASDAVRKVSDLVGEISAATSEQHRGIGEIGGGLSEIDRVTQVNSANAEEIATSSEELNGQALSLDEVVRQIRCLIEGTACDGSRRAPGAITGERRHGEPPPPKMGFLRRAEDRRRRALTA